MKYILHLTLWFAVFYVANSTVKYARFRTCKNREFVSTLLLKQRKSASTVQCALNCLSDELCSCAIYDESNEECDLYDDIIQNQQCDLLNSEHGKMILMMERSSSRTDLTSSPATEHSSSRIDMTSSPATVGQCKNNQVYDGTRCKCNVPLTGLYCENGPRDCDGMTGYGWFGIYPEDGIGKINVFCYDDCMYAFAAPMSGFAQEYLNASWNEYKYGFGAIQSGQVSPALGAYWLGNDNVHRITNGLRSYKLEYFFGYNGGLSTGRYQYFRLDAEAVDYTIHYDKYVSEDGVKLVMENGSAFSTHDKDDNGCVGYRNVGFWYSQACVADPPLYGYFRQSSNLRQYTNAFACLILM